MSSEDQNRGGTEGRGGGRDGQKGGRARSNEKVKERGTEGGEDKGTGRRKREMGGGGRNRTISVWDSAYDSFGLHLNSKVRRRCQPISAHIVHRR